MLCTLSVLRPGDRAPLAWHFDLESQASRAVALCVAAGVPIVSQVWHDWVPFGDFVSDADEFGRWLRRED